MNHIFPVLNHIESASLQVLSQTEEEHNPKRFVLGGRHVGLLSMGIVKQINKGTL